MSRHYIVLFPNQAAVPLIAMGLMGIFQAPALAQDGHGRVEVLPVLKYSVSPPLRMTPPLPPHAGPKREIPQRGIFPDAISPAQTDGAVQSTAGPFVSTSSVMNLLGVGAGFVGPQGNYTVDAAPADPNVAVGKTQVVQWVNTSFAIFDKATGVVQYGPAAGNTIWGADFPCGWTNDGDPIVQYDKAAERWVLTQLSYSLGSYYSCFAISQTSDARGSYNRYVWQFSNLNDYPKLSVWPDGYYMSFNMFRPSLFGSFTFVGAQTCAMERAKMLTGDPSPVALCFQLGSSYNSLLPSDLDGTTPPPAGSPNFYMSLGKNSLRLWRFHADFVTYSNSTLTGPISLGVASFSQACGGGTCIPQPGTSQQLDSLGDRLMYRLAYRNFGDHESLVVNHSVNVSTGNGGGRGGGSSKVGIRWYELRNPNGTPVLYQQSTFSPDSASRWMGSIAMDKAGDIAVGYSVSSSSVYPGIRHTGRVPGDPLNTLQTEGTIQDGLGSQQTGLSRWGDYSAISVDPVDDCTFWYTNEYLTGNGTFNWSTRIGSFRFPSCL